MDIYIVCNKCGHVEKNDDLRLFEDYRPSPCCPICNSEDIFIVNSIRVPEPLWDKIKKAADKKSRILEDKIKKAIEEYFEKNKM